MKIEIDFFFKSYLFYIFFSRLLGVWWLSKVPHSLRTFQWVRSMPTTHLRHSTTPLTRASRQRPPTASALSACTLAVSSFVWSKFSLTSKWPIWMQTTKGGHRWWILPYLYLIYRLTESFFTVIYVFEKNCSFYLYFWNCLLLVIIYSYKSTTLNSINEINFFVSMVRMI